MIIETFDGLEISFTYDEHIKECIICNLTKNQIPESIGITMFVKNVYDEASLGKVISEVTYYIIELENCSLKFEKYEIALFVFNILLDFEANKDKNITNLIKTEKSEYFI